MPSTRRARPTPRIVILGGAGAMGRIMVRDFQRTAGSTVQVVVADRDTSAVRGLRVEATTVDVADPTSLQRALDGAYAVIASLPYRYNLEAMHGALDAGTHYIDLGGLFHVTRRQLELAPEFERRGIMAILGMGSAPGILNVLAELAARGLDTVREIHCLVASVDRTRFRDVPPLWFGYSADTLLDEFTMPSAVYRAGRFMMVPPLDPRERTTVRFPAPIGAVAVDTTLHSEVATLPLSFRDRGIREVTFRQGFDTEFRDKLSFLVQLGLAGTTALPSATAGQPNERHIVPRDVLLALVGSHKPPVPMGKAIRYEVLRTVVGGTHRGRRVTVTADCHASGEAGWGIGPDIDTGAPPSIAAQLMLSGEIEIRPGVWAPEQVVPVEPFLRELGRRGMRVTSRTKRH
jgi:saccharopine dehydrogenase-like NADP-dependent oxidoreductase